MFSFPKYLMRVMILRTDRMSQKDIEKLTPSEMAPAETAPRRDGSRPKPTLRKADEVKKEDVADDENEAVAPVTDADESDDESA